ncbi:MAG: nucleoside kinase [Lachnospiraceae bacterium]|nr:nucleoside kinase [Lachnospiraceae bacterium]
MDTINVVCNGQKYQVEKFTTVGEFVENHYPDDRLKYVVATRNGKLSELNAVMEKDTSLELYTKSTVVGMDTYKRSLTLIMVKAFADVLGSKTNHRINVMYSMGKGYYCKLISDEVSISEQLIAKVKNRMDEIVAADMDIIKQSVSTDEAIAHFAKQGMTDKEKLFKFRRVSKANIYSLDGYEDYFYGYMVPSTAYISCYDLIPYDEGFVLLAPHKENPDVLPEFVPQRKLFEVLKTSDAWGKTLQVENVGDLNESITSGDINELMLVQEALMEKQIAEIADKILAGGKKIVLIAGPSSSGKTTFSHRLSVQLRAQGLRPYPLALDNYFVDREFTPKDENGNYDFECIEAMDLELFNSDMSKLLAGEEIEMPTFNFKIGKKEYKGKKMKLNDGDVLVAEGIHALNPLMTSELPNESKFKVYISALTQLNIDEHNRIPTTDGRLIRRIVRDARTRGNDAEGTILMWPSVRRGEEKYIFPFQEQADAMFNSALIYELSVIKQYAEPLLFAVPKTSPAYIEAKRLLKFLDYFLGLEVTNIPKNSILREFVGGGCFDL